MNRNGMHWILACGLILTAASAVSADVVTQPKRRYGLGDLGPAAISSDKRHLATAGESGAYLWDYETGVVQHRLEAHGIRVSAIAFSPDNLKLITGTRLGGIGLWSVANGEPLMLLSGHSTEVKAITVSPEGKRFVSASADNSAAVWSIQTGDLLQRVSVPGSFINAAIFTPDGTGLVTADGSRTNTVRLWDLNTGATRRILGGHNGQVLSLAFLSNGFLATGGEDRTVRIWNLETGEATTTLNGAQGGIGHLLVVPGTSLLLGGGQDQRILVWDTSTGNVLHNWASEQLNSLAWVPEGESVLISSPDLLVRIVDFKTGLTQRAFSGHTTSVTLGVSFSPDGQQVLSCGVETATRLWNRTNATLVRRFEGQGAGSYAGAFSPDGRLILTTRGVPQKVVQLWNAETGQLERQLVGHTDWLLAAAFSPDGSRIATGSQDRTLRLWKTASGELLRTLGSGAGYIHSVAFSPDGKSVAGGGSSIDPAARIWDVETGVTKAIHLADAGPVKAVAFSPSGTELFIAWEEGLVRVLNLATGQIAQELVAAGFVNDIALSPDGGYLLMAEGWPSFAARLVEWRSGKVLRTFAGHTAPVESVAFSPRGTQLLTGADLVRLWDIADLASGFQAERKNEGLELSWKRGVLQDAATLTGTWEIVTNAASPWKVSSDRASRFFRIQMDTEE